MNHMDDLESMLFGLKEVMKDSDATAIKNEIDNKIRTLGTGESIDKQTAVGFVKETVTAVSESFTKRKQQLLTDAQIVNKINDKIDDFRRESEMKVEGLINALMKDIDEAVSDYSQEVVKRLDPYTIKERFQKKEDFELWLNTINDSYKTKMEKTVDRRTQSTIRSYLVDVEDVFTMTSQYLSERESFMDAEDNFYGSLATTKNLITRDIRNSISMTTNNNKTLYEASEDLFYALWQARQKYDMKKNTTTAAVTGVVAAGTAAGAWMVTGGAAAIASTAAATGGGSVTVAAVVASAGALPIIAGLASCVIAGIVISKYASRLSAAMYSGQLEKEVRACIIDFQREINKSKISMQSQTREAITMIFENELKSLDKTFLEFRKVTYLDEDKLPQMETKLKELEGMVS